MNIIRPISKQPIPDNAKLVFKGKVFDTYQWEVVASDGSVKIFEKVKRPDTVQVLAITKDHKFVVIKEAQPGKQLTYGLPGGRVDEGEDILASAQRELLEETGYSSNEWILFRSNQPVSKVEWAIYTFIARNCEKVAEQNLDGTEDIEVYEKTLAELSDIILDQSFDDRELKTIIQNTKFKPTELKKLELELFGK